MFSIFNDSVEGKKEKIHWDFERSPDYQDTKHTFNWENTQSVRSQNFHILLEAGQRSLTAAKNGSQRVCQTPAPFPDSLPRAVILKECEVSEDCSLAFLKGPETTQKEAALALHPEIQVWLHHLVTDS